MSQEVDSRFLWSNIKQILITSSSINVRNEYMPFIQFPQSLNEQRIIPNPNRQPGQPATSIINDSVFNLNKKSVLSYVDYNYASPSPSVQSSLHRDIFYKPHFAYPIKPVLISRWYLEKKIMLNNKDFRNLLSKLFSIKLISKIYIIKFYFFIKLIL